MAGLADITQLAQDSIRDDLQRRRQQLADLDEQEAATKTAEAQSVVGLKQANPNLPLSPNADKEFSEQSVLNESRMNHLADQRQAATQNLPTVHGVLNDWLGSAAQFVDEDPQARHDELATDPRGRAARLDAAKQTLLSQMSGGRGLDGQGDANSVRPFSQGTGAAGEPYFTNKTEGELASQNAPVQGIGPGPTSSGALHPMTGMDLGGGGGGLSVVSGTPSAGSPAEQARAALLQHLTAESAAAKQAKLTPQEEAGARLKYEPQYDDTFSKLGFQAGREQLIQDTANGAVPPEIGAQIEAEKTKLYNTAAKPYAGIPNAQAHVDQAFRSLLDAHRLVSPDKAAAAATAAPTDGLQRASADVAQRTQQATDTARSTGPGTAAPTRFDVNAPDPATNPSDTLYDRLLRELAFAGTGAPMIAGR